MLKLKITQKQYDSIILHEHKTRLNDSTSLLNENLDQSTELLEEGWRDVVLGVAMMLGVGLTGHNKLIAQNAVKNADTMNQIKSTLEDEDKIGELVDAFKEKGLKNPEEKLASNAEQVVDAFNRISKDENLGYKVELKGVNNLQGLRGSLAQGYALKKAEISTDTVHSEKQITITVTDTIDIELGSDRLFITGGFTLNEGGIDTINTTLNKIKELGGKIQSVDIESSTDSEIIKKFITKDDPTGNIKLADLRTQSISNLILSVVVVPIKHREIPNNGSNVVSKKDFIKAANNQEATNALREKTREFRYTKIRITAIFESIDSVKTPIPDELIKTYRFELVRVVTEIGKIGKIKTKVTFKNKKLRCSNKNKGKNKNVDCATF